MGWDDFPKKKQDSETLDLKQLTDYFSPVGLAAIVCCVALLILIGVARLSGGGSDSSPNDGVQQAQQVEKVETEVNPVVIDGPQINECVSQIGVENQKFNIPADRQIELLGDKAVLTGYIYAKGKTSFASEVYLFLVHSITACPSALDSIKTIQERKDRNEQVRKMFKDCPLRNSRKEILTATVNNLIYMTNVETLKGLASQCGSCSLERSYAACVECGKAVSQMSLSFYRN